MIQAISVTIIMLINLLMNPVFNFPGNMLCAGIASYFFYSEYSSKKFIRVLEAEVLLVIIGLIEAFGVYMADIIRNILGIVLDSIEIKQSIDTAFSKIILLFVYYVFLIECGRKVLYAQKRSMYYT